VLFGFVGVSGVLGRDFAAIVFCIGDIYFGGVVAVVVTAAALVAIATIGFFSVVVVVAVACIFIFVAVIFLCFFWGEFPGLWGCRWGFGGILHFECEDHFSWCEGDWEIG
jgi:hypothetical protein